MTVDCRGVRTIGFSPHGETIRAAGRFLPTLTFDSETPSFLDKVRNRLYDTEVVFRLGDPHALVWASFAESDRNAQIEIRTDSATLGRIREYPQADIRIDLEITDQLRLDSERIFSSRATVSMLSVVATYQSQPLNLEGEEERTRSFVYSAHSQIGNVAKELLASSRTSGSPGRADPSLWYVKSITEGLRAAVAHPEDEAVIFRLAAAEFREHFEKLEKTEKEKYVNYDHVAYHRSARDLIVSGKITKPGEDLSTDQLEEVARTYFARPDLASPTLEWLLIDNLLFNETIEFYRSQDWIPRLDGPMAILRSTTWTLIKWTFKEGFLLIGTAAIAGLLDPAKGIGFWAVVATITLARWMKPNQVEVAKEKTIKLLNDMAAAQHLMHRRDFNARQLREALYEISSRGAVFSPCAFSLLDRRIRREEITILPSVGQAT
ncbi:MAG: hypothetical protein WA190_17640 [Usitatibacter sp.]